MISLVLYLVSFFVLPVLYIFISHIFYLASAFIKAINFGGMAVQSSLLASLGTMHPLAITNISIVQRPQ